MSGLAVVVAPCRGPSSHGGRGLPDWVVQIKDVLTLVGTHMDSPLEGKERTKWTAVWGVVSAGAVSHWGNNQEEGMSGPLVVPAE